MIRLIATATAIVGAAAIPAPVTWPGGGAMRAADTAAALGANLSGLAFDGSAGLWAVRDSGALLHLERSGSGWKRSAGEAGERSLRYPGGTGSPDAEAITTVNGDDAAVYVAAERDNGASNTSRNSILRFETSGTSLTATREWRLDAVFGATPANTGVESLTWIPDSVLVAMGFRTTDGKPYAPADYADHGTGLFASAVESRGEIAFLALHSDGKVTQVGTAASGLAAIMDLSWSSARQELWATCDSHCNGNAAVLHPADGAFQVVAVVHPPAGMDALNDEGFAIVPTCTNGSMLAVWSDDSATGGTSLHEAALPCDPLGVAVKNPTATSTTATSTTATSTTAPAAPTAVAGTTSSSDRSVAYVGVGAVAAVGAAAVLAFRRRRRVPQ
jgi:Esterase-like activity of phytase